MDMGELLENFRTQLNSSLLQLCVQPWLGEKALNGDLKAYLSPFILHLATHGFFQKNQAGDSARDIDLLLAEFLTPTAHMAASAKVDTNRPYLRSGLALAGANTWLTGGTPPPEAEDGLLTTEDVLSMDLSATELVVLSACDLSEFYHYLLNGWPRVGALRDAQLMMKAKYAYPYYWGAFIGQGDPSPLPSRT